MELITNNELIVMIGFMVGYIIILAIISRVEDKKRMRKFTRRDDNIEWYGPDIYLKEKDYGHLENDDKEIADTEKYKNEAKQRIENVKKRNNGSNSKPTTFIGD